MFSWLLSRAAACSADRMKVFFFKLMEKNFQSLNHSHQIHVNHVLKTTMIGVRDVKLEEKHPKELLLDKHVQYLKQYANDDGTDVDQIMAEHLKMSGMYWGLNALYIMNVLDAQQDTSQVEIPKALEFIKKCQNPSDGGFTAAPNHDSHLLHTLSAVQLLVILNKCIKEYIDTERCVQYVKSLQQPDGSFFGDKWGEIDTRFSCCALATLKLLNRLDAIDLDKAVDFVLACRNEIDGGFGRMPGSESHTAYVYCCISSLAIANRLDDIDKEALGQWLSERQLPSGGLNGRPEKLPDLCYSWWCLSSMKMINKMHLIDHKRLLSFILACQDDEQGGFSDRPGNWVDPYHTMFGLASISLMCKHYSRDKQQQDDGDDHRVRDERFLEMVHQLEHKLKPVDPMLCMPEDRL